MKKSDLKVMVIKDGTDKGYCAYIKGLPAIASQSLSLEDVPRDLARLFEIYLEMAIKEKHYSIVEIGK